MHKLNNYLFDLLHIYNTRLMYKYAFIWFIQS